MSLIKRIASALFSKPATEADPPAEVTSVTPNDAFAPIDGDATTMNWFNGGHRATGRDSIDSNPDTSRWYRRPRYVVPGAAVHRPSGSFSGR